MRSQSLTIHVQLGVYLFNLIQMCISTRCVKDTCTSACKQIHTFAFRFCKLESFCSVIIRSLSARQTQSRKAHICELTDNNNKPAGPQIWKTKYIIWKCLLIKPYYPSYNLNIIHMIVFWSVTSMIKVI